MSREDQHSYPYYYDPYANPFDLITSMMPMMTAFLMIGMAVKIGVFLGSSPRGKVTSPEKVSEEIIHQPEEMKEIRVKKKSNRKLSPLKKLKKQGEEMATDEDQEKYTLWHLNGELHVLKMHLSEGGLIRGKRCDCLTGHADTIYKLASEGLSFASEKTRRLLEEIRDWIVKARPIFKTIEQMPTKLVEERKKLAEPWKEQARAFYKEIMALESS